MFRNGKEKEKKRGRLVVEETKDNMGWIFFTDVTPLTEVYLFRYLGKTFSSAGDDWPEVEKNLRRAQVKWVWLANILGRYGADNRTAGRLYVVVVQAVLLLGS